MKRMTFELPDDAIVLAFTAVMNENCGRDIVTFTECHRVEHGTILALVKDGTYEKPYSIKKRKEMEC